MGGILIRPGRPEDAPRLAELMTDGLQTRFSGLGGGVVTLLHRQMTVSKHCLCVVAEREGTIGGYAAVLTSGRSFYREFLVKQGFLCGALALPRLFRISNLRTAATALLYFPRSASGDPDAELVSIVVDRAMRGAGIGRELWNAAVSGLRLRNVADLKIATGVDNEAANRMYRERGCRMIRRERLYHDTEVNVYWYSVNGGEMTLC